jgi:hypothetical protein
MNLASIKSYDDISPAAESSGFLGSGMDAVVDYDDALYLSSS